MDVEKEIDKDELYVQLGTYEDTIETGSKIAQAALELAYSIPDQEYCELHGLKILSKEFWIPMRDVKYFSSKWFINKFVTSSILISKFGF